MKRHHWLLLFGLVALAFVLFAVLLIVTAPPAIAPTRPQNQNLDDATMKVASSLYCPVCPGVPLDVCDTAACQQWRGLIREKLAAGQSPQQIQEYFVSQYGDRVLGAPKPEGFNLAIYLAPVGAIAAGALILYAALRSWMAGRAESEVLVPTSELRERIEQELKETR